MVARLSEQLGTAIRPGPPDCRGLIVKLARLRNESYPGRDAHGVLPMLVVGHEMLSEAEWARWVKEKASAPYGLAYAAKLAKQGIDLKDMLPTAPIGREMRVRQEDRSVSESGRYHYLNMAGAILTMVERWPSLYNLIAEELSEQEMTLSEFVERVRTMPSPWEIGEGRYYTLGDLIGRLIVVTPSW
jgi:hypothetical protein